MEHMVIRAVATDVDGTLAPGDSNIPLESIKAIRDLEAKGIAVILASGNIYPSLMGLRRYLGCSGAIICEGGGAVEYRGEVRIIGSKEKALRALRRLRELFGDRIVEPWSNPYRFTDIAIERRVEKCLIEDVLREFPDVRLFDTGFYYHIIDKAANKGVGLRAAAEMMGLRLEEVAAIGDSENDLDMLQEAGFAAVVANAPPFMKEVADYVASRPNGQGFVEIAELIMASRTQ
ncbi:MAG: phosphoglycolate phosphatase [Candidatus Bathyarchaeia archaeon]